MGNFLNGVIKLFELCANIGVPAVQVIDLSSRAAKNNYQPLGGDNDFAAVIPDANVHKSKEPKPTKAQDLIEKAFEKNRAEQKAAEARPAPTPDTNSPDDARPRFEEEMKKAKAADSFGDFQKISKKANSHKNSSVEDSITQKEIEIIDARRHARRYDDNFKPMDLSGLGSAQPSPPPPQPVNTAAPAEAAPSMLQRLKDKFKSEPKAEAAEDTSVITLKGPLPTGQRIGVVDAPKNTDKLIQILNTHTPGGGWERSKPVGNVEGTSITNASRDMQFEVTKTGFSTKDSKVETFEAMLKGIKGIYEGANPTVTCSKANEEKWMTAAKNLGVTIEIQIAKPKSAVTAAATATSAQEKKPEAPTPLATRPGKH
jgi:hypothetical protein